MLSLVFPGQGSQYIGMGRDFSHNFPIANEVYREVDDVLGFSLSKLIFNGQIEDLTLTKNAQPAIMATSIAILKTLENEGFKIKKSKFVAGHSLGEYSALACSDVINFKETITLLKKRGSAMQNAVPKGEGGMLAVLGSTIDKIEIKRLHDEKQMLEKKFNYEKQILQKKNIDLENGLQELTIKHRKDIAQKINSLKSKWKKDIRYIIQKNILTKYIQK